MRCSKCGAELKPDEAVNVGGRVLCEDCYFDEVDKVRTCDPWAVMLAKKAKTGEKITQRQQAIYDLIRKRGKIKVEEIARELGMKIIEVEREIAVLRHLELVKGRKEGNEVFIVPFDA